MPTDFNTQDAYQALPCAVLMTALTTPPAPWNVHVGNMSSCDFVESVVSDVVGVLWSNREPRWNCRLSFTPTKFLAPLWGVMPIWAAATPIL